MFENFHKNKQYKQRVNTLNLSIGKLLNIDYLVGRLFYVIINHRYVVVWSETSWLAKSSVSLKSFNKLPQKYLQSKIVHQYSSINTPLLLGTCKLIDLATINHSPLARHHLSRPRVEGPTRNPAASTTNPSTNTWALGMLLLRSNRVRVFIQLPLLNMRVTSMKVVLSNCRI